MMEQIRILSCCPQDVTVIGNAFLDRFLPEANGDFLRVYLYLLRSAGRRKPYMIFALTDETYSLVCAAPERDARFIFRVSLLDQCWWVAGSVLGSLAGALIPFDSRGIDFSLTALFLTVVADQWRDKANRGPALVGLGVSAVCLGLFGPESFLLPSMGGILVLLLVLFRGREGGAAHD